ncbi:MAG: Oxidoreductase FAD-binding domain protein, partial [Mycobacterium sp.]|nr:Oxidoreductase FAD-binding domain protein [Mycobacterium sp.]
MLGSPLVHLLTGPHGVDRYTELVEPTWTLGEARARVAAVQQSTPGSITLTLEPNAAYGRLPRLRAGQHLTVTFEIDGRRRSRCYSPADAEGSATIELTIGRHRGGLVSDHLYDHARPGMVVGLSAPGGDFVLPDPRPDRILMVAGGSGITPIMSMLRTLRADGHTGEVAVLRYAPSAIEACYRDELAAMTNVSVLHGFTRVTDDTDLTGHFGASHVARAMSDPQAVFVCGPPALAEAVRQLYPTAVAETFVPPTFTAPAQSSG